MIPKRIFQTHSFTASELPPAAKKAMQTWKDHNPEYHHIYMSDPEMMDYIKSCGPNWQTIAKLCRVPVMLADLWRYLITFNEGGVYSDLDTICREPIDTWVPSNKTFVTAPEDAWAICQWTFACDKNHPIMAVVLEEILARFNHPLGPDYTNPFCVHDLTGPAVWTDAIRKALGSRGRPHFGASEYYNNLPRARETNFFLHHSPIFKGIYVDHIYESMGNWSQVQKVPWVYQKDEIVRLELERQRGE